MYSEQLLKYVHNLRSALGIVQANIKLIIEGTSDGVGALSDALEATNKMQTILDEMHRVEENEITQEMCPHKVRIERREPEPGVVRCVCCGTGCFGRYCALCT